MRLERVTIAAAGADLAGLAYEPDAARARGVVVLSHGFTSSKASMDLLAAYLCRRGFACVTYDCRGHLLGASTGRLEHMGEAVEDLARVIGFARERFGVDDVELVGHSMGALLSFAAAERDADVWAVVAIATGPQPSASFTSQLGAAMLAQRVPYVDGAPAIVLLREMDGLADSIGRYGYRPSLFVAARSDVLVKPFVLRSMAERAGSRAEFAEIDAAHLDAPDRARGVVAAFLERLHPKKP